MTNFHFSNTLRNDDQKRRRLFDAILPLVIDVENDWMWLLYSDTPLVTNKDFEWLLDRFENTQPEHEQRILVRLIERIVDFHDTDQSEAIFRASQNNPILAEAFAWLLKPVELNSDAARTLKESHYESLEWQQHQANTPLLDPPLAERVIRVLDRFDAGDLSAWTQLIFEMTLEPDSTHYRDDFDGDLTTLPGWLEANDITKARIVEAAKKYILEGEPETEKWLGTNSYYYSALNGYRALRLLHQEASDYIASIPADVWKKWAPMIVAYPTTSSTEKRKAQQKLLELAYRHAPNEIIRTLDILIDKDNKEFQHVVIADRIMTCWDDYLANALLDKVRDKELTPNSMGDLLSILLEHNVAEAEEFAKSLLPSPLPSDDDGRARAIVAAHILLSHAKDAGWSRVWPHMKYDLAFGQEVISVVAHQGSYGHSLNMGQLAEDELADLYIWLVQQYPYEHDPKPQGVHFVSPQESASEFKSYVLTHLKERGTPEACTEIKRIMQALPDLDWLKWTLLGAQENTRRRTWVPPEPGSILKLASDQQLRLVQNGEQLLDVLVESLQRLEEKLQGETPAVQFLWDKTGERIYRPKDENSFSDFVKLHLDDDLRDRGIVANREVVIRPTMGANRGERTDIHVDAVMRDATGQVYDTITAIVEVKGNWHQDVRHAMQTQLVDRYLKDNQCRYGLYLVGWFTCSQWNPEDSKKHKAPKISLGEAREIFRAQAAELSQHEVTIRAVVLNTALR